jgi:signal transduction histidine kinase
MSLRFRFLLAVMAWVLLGISAIWFSATRVFSSHVEESFHAELNVHVRELARLTRIGEQGPVLIRPLSDPRYDVPLSGYYWQVTAGGKTLRSRSMTHGSLDQEVAHSHTISHRVERGPTGPVIAYGMSEQAPDGEQVHLVIATDQSELDEVLGSFTRELRIWLAALVVLLLATGAGILVLALKPLDRLASAIGRLRSGQVSRLEGEYPAEIAPLVSDLNDYIAQNSDMIARARVQAGNLAHSLRTPLAVITDEAERLAERENTRESASVLLDQAERMEQQINYQLARARSTAGARVPGANTLLPDVLVPVLAAMRRLHPAKRFDISAEPAQPVSVPVDAVDLSELLSILLDNAGKWAREFVRTEIDTAPEAVIIRIHDDGPGMTADQIAKAFDIGTRFDPETPGSGLGLAIAGDISEAMKAALRLSSGPTGLCAELTIPLHQS